MLAGLDFSLAQVCEQSGETVHLINTQLTLYTQELQVFPRIVAFTLRRLVLLGKHASIIELTDFHNENLRYIFLC